MYSIETSPFSNFVWVLMMPICNVPSVEGKLFVQPHGVKEE